ncbi:MULTISPECIES: peptide ABC transporter substrate-binding protein [Pseudarthrobacter]|uniref:ABC transporter substrate-binding protein n=2 Tax=Pseudarthrobacter TaxID=1742993 RepID=A0ABQ1XFB4_9MICC|nr:MULTISPECIES: ABC transporter substrate-binding protein [Pseudarthrobacter]MBD1539422.1 ABC transporter substrate-binding protein [Arthrobacter sp. S13_S34]MBD1590785.1 ABC transporter substrate-binding protein [Arthrobacter sp. S1_S22]GGG92925.1 ABC transporter substrate-binding protein [Pseudarthrobacter polychromogenes]GGI72350.1 ABC transporter substrate-binding protein [Pseudarthrobacter scleromae]
MRFTRTSKALGMVAIAALALTGCGAGGGSNEGASDAAGDPAKIITAYSNEPQNPLLPANTNEVYGGRVVELLFEGLTSYSPSGESVNALAESIESPDGQNYTIKVKSGTKFTNGEEVTAKSFVDAWNFAALSTNAQANSSFFESIEGYDAVSATKKEGETEVPAPTAETLSGLVLKDDSTIEVKLTQPEADWPLRLGYTAFMPLPSEAIADPKAYGENPVGNGPYKMAKEGAWQHDSQIELVKNEDYAGTREAKNGGVTFKFYTDPAPAYTDIQANNLDVTDVLPTNALKTYTMDFPDNHLNKPYAGNSTLNIPGYLPEFQGEAGKLRRQAISMAINRDEITKVIFSGTRIPAKDFTSPAVDGYNENVEGSDVLKFDAAKAKETWEKANAISPWPADKTLQLGYNTDGGNKEWIDAVANNLKNNLGIQAEGQPFAKFAELLDLRKSQTLPGFARAGWQADYPSLYNFLGPLLRTGASANYEGYSNPEFDKLLDEGLGSKSTDDANAKFTEAQEILFQDLPNLPLWYSARQVVWSQNVTNVDSGWNGVIQYYNITAK